MSEAPGNNAGNIENKHAGMVRANATFGKPSLITLDLQG
jgi:hypothetical protein